VVPDAAIHQHDEIMQVFGIGRLLPQRDGERCQRRLQAVRQVGDMLSRAFEVGRVLDQQRVEFFGQRLHFSGLSLRHVVAEPRSDLGDRTAKPLQRPQSETDLDQHGADQCDTEHAERQSQGAHRLPERAHHRLSRRGRHDRRWACGRRHVQNAEMKTVAVWTHAVGRRRAVSHRRIVFHPRWRRRWRRRRAVDVGMGNIRSIERPGPQHVFRTRDLPIPAVPTPIERRSVGGSRKAQVASAIGIEHGRQKKDLGIEPLVDLSLHETMQDERDQSRGDDQRRSDEHAGSDHEASAKRCVPAHHREAELSL
jgi:hypothetical protein